MEGEDWGLQAIVSGHRAAEDPFFSFSSSCSLLDGGGATGTSVVDDDLFFYFPDLLTTTTALQELDELCRPFLPPPAPQPSLPPPMTMMQQNNSGVPSAVPAVVPMISGGRVVAGRIFQQSPQQLQQQRMGVPQQGRQPHPRPATQTPRSKRRKNQQKKVVCHVPADGLSSDVWAWRKYGQKPIKGSPYPRGYYRCSSSKGCPARKQVERSRTDPNTFVLTYTAEHNHPAPTHRNSLAGSTRQKFPPSSSSSSVTSTANPEPISANEKASTSSPLCSPGPSPALSSSTDHDDTIPEIIEEDVDGGLIVNDMNMLDMDDMLFMGLDEIQGYHSSTSMTAGAEFDKGFSEEFSAAFSPSSWMVDGAS